jgi:hypothetical protein
MNLIFSTREFVAIAGTGLNRLLKQRSALRKRGHRFSDLPPQRGGLRILSGGAVFLAAKILS